MVTYVLLFLLFAILSFTDFLYIPALYKKVFSYLGCAFVFLLIWTLGSIRWQTGTDWASYYDSFMYFSDDYAINFEPGFVLFLSSIRNLTSSYSLYLVIFTFLCVAIKLGYFYKFHKETFFTLVFLFYCYYFADIFAVRQNLAISITLLSTVFIIKRKPIYFILFVLLASSFHIASVLYLFGYYIYWSTWSDKHYYIAVFLSIFLGVIGFGNIVLNQILNALGVDGFIGQKISNYLSGNSEEQLTTGNSTLIYFLGVAKRLMLIPLFFYILKISKAKFPYFQGYFNLYVAGNIIYFLFAKDLTVFARASVPFLLFEIFLMSYTLAFFKTSKKIIVFGFLIMVLFSWARFSALVNSYYDLYVPYNSIFDDKIERNL